MAPAVQSEVAASIRQAEPFAQPDMLVRAHYSAVSILVGPSALIRYVVPRSSSGAAGDANFTDGGAAVRLVLGRIAYSPRAMSPKR